MSSISCVFIIVRKCGCLVMPSERQYLRVSALFRTNLSQLFGLVCIAQQKRPRVLRTTDVTTPTTTIRSRNGVYWRDGRSTRSSFRGLEEYWGCTGENGCNGCNDCDDWDGCDAPLKLLRWRRGSGRESWVRVSRSRDIVDL